MQRERQGQAEKESLASIANAFGAASSISNDFSGSGSGGGGYYDDEKACCARLQSTENDIVRQTLQQKIKSKRFFFFNSLLSVLILFCVALERELSVLRSQRARLSRQSAADNTARVHRKLGAGDETATLSGGAAAAPRGDAPQLVYVIPFIEAHVPRVLELFEKHWKVFPPCGKRGDEVK